MIIKVEVTKHGSKVWYNNDRDHNKYKPSIEWDDGGKEWWVNGLRNRTDGPAIEYLDGSNEWWANGQLHRENGPAVEWSDGYKEWYIDGINYSYLEYLVEIEQYKLNKEHVWQLNYT